MRRGGGEGGIREDTCKGMKIRTRRQQSKTLSLSSKQAVFSKPQEFTRVNPPIDLRPQVTAAPSERQADPPLHLACLASLVLSPSIMICTA